MFSRILSVHINSCNFDLKESWVLFIRLKNFLRKNLFLVSLRLRLRGEEVGKYVVNKVDTDICIDGYPRSANSFSVRMFRQANPDSKIAHHTHSIGNLKKAILHGIPSVALIRNPEQAIVSSVIAHEMDCVDDEIYRYIYTYRWVKSNLDNLVIADFDRVINNFNDVVTDINKRFDKSFNLLEDVYDADMQVKNDIEKRYDKLGQTKMSHIKPVPSKHRSEKQEKLVAVILNHKMFNEAKVLYDEIMLSIYK